MQTNCTNSQKHNLKIMQTYPERSLMFHHRVDNVCVVVCVLASIFGFLFFFLRKAVVDLLLHRKHSNWPNTLSVAALRMSYSLVVSCNTLLGSLERYAVEYSKQNNIQQLSGRRLDFTENNFSRLLLDCNRYCFK